MSTPFPRFFRASSPSEQPSSAHLAQWVRWTPLLLASLLTSWLALTSRGTDRSLALFSGLLLLGAVAGVFYAIYQQFQQQSLAHQKAAFLLERTRELQSYIAAVNRASFDLAHEEDFLQTVCDLACQKGRLALAVVSCPDEGGFLRVRACAGKTGYLKGPSFSIRADLPEGQGPCGHAWRNRQAVFNARFSSRDLALWQDQAQAYGLEASATLPLHQDGQLWGLLGLYRADDVVFDPPMQRLLLGLADDVSRGLDTINNNQRLRILDRAVGALSEGLTIADAHRRLTFSNPAFSRISGFSTAEALGKDCEFLQSEATSPETVQAIRAALLAGTSFDGEVLNTRKDGTPFWNHLHLDAVRDSQGAVTHFVGVQRDVTEQKQAKDLQHALLENTASGILIARDRRILATNTTMSLLVGQDLQLLKGQSTRLLYDDEKEFLRVGAAYNDLEELETTSLSNVRIRRQDGQVLLCDLHGRLLPDGTTTVWTYSDVTQREAHAQALKRAQRVYRAMIAGSESLLQSTTESSMLSRLCHQLVQSTDFTSIWVGCQDSDGTIAAIALASTSEAEQARLREFRVNPQDASSTIAKAWRSQSLIVDAPVDTKACALLAVPVFRAGQMWAVMAFSASCEDLLDEATRQACQQIAGLLGHGLDELDRKSTLQALQDAESLRARTDVLTGLPNRLAFEEYLPRAIARAQRHKTAVAVGLLDLDNFKPVNDQFGHHVGDILLRQIAQSLNTKMRSTDLLARIGGDEFVLILENLDPENIRAELQSVMARLYSCVDQPFELGEGRIARVGITAGLAAYPADADQAHALLRMADTAMYACKAHKEDRGSWWRMAGEDDASQSSQSEPRLDAFDEKSMALLEQLRPGLKPLAHALAEVLYDDLSQDDRHGKTMGLRSKQELAGVKAQLALHLQFLLDPQTSLPQIQDRAAHLGQIHALVGLQGASLERAFVLCEEFLQGRLEGMGLAPRQRYLTLRVATSRLRLDLHAQLEAVEKTTFTYSNVLRSKLSSDGSWSEVLSQALGDLSRLPGIANAIVFRPDENGTLRLAAGAGLSYSKVASLVESEQLHPSLTSHPGGVRGPLSTAWFERQTQVIDVYQEDDRLSRWKNLGAQFGWGSAAAVPISNADATDSVLVIFGRLAHQFSSPWAASWLDLLRSRMDGLFAETSRDQHLIEPAQVRHYREMLYGKGLQMWVQPLVDLRTGQARKVEALARLRTPDGKILAPGQFLPAFGEQELHALFRQGLAQALDIARAHNQAGQELEVAVNLPPVTLAHPECAAWVRQALTRAEIDPRRLTLEVLETEELDASRVDKHIHSISALGVRLALDDLGSGYSNLTRLASLPIDTVKIDQSLMRELPKQPIKTMRLLATLMSIGNEFAQRVVIEGLEDAGCVEVALLLGADIGQGYGLARPMEAAALQAWRSSWRMSCDVEQLQTWLGAFTYHWLNTRGVAPQKSRVSLTQCPLGDFLHRQGQTDGEVLQWLKASHSTKDDERRQTSAESLLLWLAQQVQVRDRAA